MRPAQAQRHATLHSCNASGKHEKPQRTVSRGRATAPARRHAASRFAPPTASVALPAAAGNFQRAITLAAPRHVRSPRPPPIVTDSRTSGCSHVVHPDRQMSAVISSRGLARGRSTRNFSTLHSRIAMRELRGGHADGACRARSPHHVPRGSVMARAATQEHEGRRSSALPPLTLDRLRDKLMEPLFRSTSATRGGSSTAPQSHLFTTTPHITLAPSLPPPPLSLPSTLLFVSPPTPPDNHLPTLLPSPPSSPSKPPPH